MLIVVGLIYHHASALNDQARRAILATPDTTPTPLIQAVVLPSGHTSPLSPNGAQFNEAEIPSALRPFQQAYSALPLPTQAPQHARSILIPRLWQDAVPVVQGDGWEQLKKGIAQHLGTANPGEPGNLVLSGHNDIYGEWFRYLDVLEPGDPIYVSTAAREFTYRVTGTRIVEPTEVSVMKPTTQATITLISCYPYLVDTQRIVVFGALDA
jgi:sortase A